MKEVEKEAQDHCVDVYKYTLLLKNLESVFLLLLFPFLFLPAMIN